MITQSHYSENTFFCPHCGQYQEPLQGDTSDTIIRCLNCHEKFQIKDAIKTVDEALNFVFKLLGENHGRN